MPPIPEDDRGKLPSTLRRLVVESTVGDIVGSAPAEATYAAAAGRTF